MIVWEDHQPGCLEIDCAAGRIHPPGLVQVRFCYSPFELEGETDTKYQRNVTCTILKRKIADTCALVLMHTHEY